MQGKVAAGCGSGKKGGDFFGQHCLRSLGERLVCSGGISNGCGDGGVVVTEAQWAAVTTVGGSDGSGGNTRQWIGQLRWKQRRQRQEWRWKQRQREATDRAVVTEVAMVMEAAAATGAVAECNQIN